MEVALKKMGNSTAVVIPPPVLKDLRIAAGQPMHLDVVDGTIVLTPKRTRYVLADLLAQCDQDAPPPEGMPW